VSDSGRFGFGIRRISSKRHPYELPRHKRS